MILFASISAHWQNNCIILLSSMNLSVSFTETSNSQRKKFSVAFLPGWFSDQLSGLFINSGLCCWSKKRGYCIKNLLRAFTLLLLFLLCGSHKLSGFQCHLSISWIHSVAPKNEFNQPSLFTQSFFLFSLNKQSFCRSWNSSFSDFLYVHINPISPHN